jgi:hypothetical protein
MTSEIERLCDIARRADLAKSVIAINRGFARRLNEEAFLAGLANQTLVQRLRRVSSAELRELFRRDVSALIGLPF